MLKSQLSENPEITNENIAGLIEYLKNTHDFSVMKIQEEIEKLSYQDLRDLLEFKEIDYSMDLDSDSMKTILKSQFLHSHPAYKKIIKESKEKCQPHSTPDIYCDGKKRECSKLCIRLGVKDIGLAEIN